MKDIDKIKDLRARGVDLNNELSDEFILAEAHQIGEYELDVEVSDKIEFQVVEKESKGVDVYGTGDKITRPEFLVNRKLLTSDLSPLQGGTGEDKYSYTDGLLKIFESEGRETIETFRSEKIAKFFAEALNKTSQSVLKELLDRDD
tara:strand:+ start:48532 stop:48969 length:438 start_codon:yes stop_codon:yes gene_type:complete